MLAATLALTAFAAVAAGAQAADKFRCSVALCRGTVKPEVACPTGKKIEITYNGCVIGILGGFESVGVGYTTLGSVNRDMTATAADVDVPSASIQVIGTKAQCTVDPEESFTGTYTTGNTLVTGESMAGVMAEAWYG